MEELRPCPRCGSKDIRVSRRITSAFLSRATSRAFSSRQRPIPVPWRSGSEASRWITATRSVFIAQSTCRGNIQKVRTGERLAGRATAASDFTEIDAEDDAEEAFAENDLPDYLN